jgi:cytochrome c6
VRIAAILLTTVALAGCGGSDSDSDGGGEQSPRDQFAGTCGSCHTLEDAGTDGSFGPNLDELAPDKERVLAAIETGPGEMPDGLLDGAAADAVAGYVAGAAGK